MQFYLYEPNLQSRAINHSIVRLYVGRHQWYTTHRNCKPQSVFHHLVLLVQGLTKRVKRYWLPAIKKYYVWGFHCTSTHVGFAIVSMYFKVNPRRQREDMLYGLLPPVQIETNPQHQAGLWSLSVLLMHITGAHVSFHNWFGAWSSHLGRPNVISTKDLLVNVPTTTTLNRHEVLWWLCRVWTKTRTPCQCAPTTYSCIQEHVSGLRWHGYHQLWFHWYHHAG